MSHQPAPGSPAPAAAFSIVRVFIILLVCGGIGGAAWLLQQELQGPRPRYAFTGQVLFQGKPVTTGSVMTQHAEDQFDAALGFLDEEGRFSLDTNGDPGASLGIHKVVISSMAPGIPPRPLVPAVYVDLKTTPLTLQVTSDPAKNKVVFELQGELPAAPAPPAGGPPGAGGPGGPPPGGRPALEDSDPAAPAAPNPPAEPAEPAAAGATDASSTSGDQPKPE